MKCSLHFPWNPRLWLRTYRLKIIKLTDMSIICVLPLLATPTPGSTVVLSYFQATSYGTRATRSSNSLKTSRSFCNSWSFSFLDSLFFSAVCKLGSCCCYWVFLWFHKRKIRGGDVMICANARHQERESSVSVGGGDLLGIWRTHLRNGAAPFSSLHRSDRFLAVVVKSGPISPHFLCYPIFW